MKSIQTKIVAMLLLIVVLSTTIVGVIGIITTSRILHNSADKNLKLLCESNAKQFNSLLGRVKESVDTLSHHITTELASTQALSQNEYRKNFINSVESIGINHLKNTEGALSIYFYINHDIVDTPDGFFWVRLEDGSLFNNPLTDARLYSKDDIEHAGWWYLPTEKKNPIWIRSYLNKNIDTYMFSYVVPVYKNGNLYGILGMDVACEEVANIAKQVSIYDSGFAAILERDASIIYHPSYPFGTLIQHTQKEFAKTAEFILENKNHSELLSYEIDNTPKKMSYSVLDNGMILCVIAPDAEIYREQHHLQLQITTLIIITIIVSLIISIGFARRLTKPIKELNFAAKQMTMGNLNVHLEPYTKDEVGELTVSFSEAQQKLKNHMDELFIEAHRDGLTGVNNKTSLRETEDELNSLIETQNCSFAVAVFDVNRLKITNDVLGHIAGDNLLKTISSYLIDSFHRHNVYRIGGDEFVVIQRDDKAQGFEERITACAEGIRTLSLKDHPGVKISCAAGAAVFDRNMDTCFSDVLTRADKNMYDNKTALKSIEALESSKALRRIQIDKYLELLNVISQSTDEYPFLFDIASDIIYFPCNINEHFDICNNEAKTSTFKELLEIVHPGDKAIAENYIKNVLSFSSQAKDINCRWINKKGETVWINFCGKTVNDDNNKPFVMIGTVSQDALKFLYSPLTGLFNKTKQRNDFQNNIAPDFKSFMLINIDGTTNINIKHGRRYGDDVLCVLAKILESKFPIKTVYHMELDKFALLLDTDSHREIENIFNDIQSSIDNAFTISAAVIPYGNTGFITKDNIYDYARQVLKENKENGIGILSFMSDEYVKNKLFAIELAEELEKSVQNNFEGFFLCYQPQINAADYSVCSAEALLRYNSPSKGIVPPNEFIPILESTGLIHKVGIWVLETALKQCKNWRSFKENFRISVNFSPLQFSNPLLANLVIDTLNDTGVDGSALTIEITESVQIENTDAFNEIFALFKNEDIQISIDDFGTGYSNLNYLEKIHADEIKIDRIFIQNIDLNSYNYRIITNIIDFAKTNSLSVCLEGVEKVEELAVLESLKPDILQGYLFNKPLVADEFERNYFTKGTDEYTKQQSFIKELNKHREKHHIVQLNTGEILSQIDIGLWVIRYDTKKQSGELFIDSVMRELLGADEKLTPLECYNFWYDKIKPGNEKIVNDMVSSMSKSTKVNQAEYQWIHPKRGEITVRCTGKCVRITDGIITYEGFHRIISDMDNSFNS